MTTKPIYKTFEDFNYNDLLTYAGLDCIVTSTIFEKMRPSLAAPFILKDINNAGEIVKTEKRESVFEVTRSWEHKFHEFIIDMELNGIKYDVEGNEALKERMEEEIEELKGSVFSCLGKAVDLDSGKVLSHLLFEELGLTTERKTKTGQLSTDFEALQEMSERYPEHTWLIDLAKYGDLVSAYRTFVQNYVKDHVKRDGRIHPQYNLHGTSSFRITGDSPNLTQLPNAKHGYNIRTLFTVDEGYAFLTADFSSAEIKILGAISQDPGILQSIKDGLDFHSFAASRIHNIPYADFVAVLDAGKSHPLFKKYKGFRQGAKAVGFGILYGSTAAGVAYGLGITSAEAQELIDLYFRLFPKLKDYIEFTHKMAVDNKAIITPFGRRKMQYGLLNCFAKTAVWNAAKRNAQNCMIQSSTSDVGLFAFMSVNEKIKLLGGKTLCTVYDSIELEIPIPRLEEALEIVYHCMDDLPVETFDWITLPIGVEVELGHNWGEVTPVHRGTKQNELERILG